MMGTLYMYKQIYDISGLYCIWADIAGHMYGDMGNEEIPKICTAALKSGVNFIDTSPWYRSSQGRIV